MDRSTARTVANIVLGAAGLGVAFVVLRRPPLGRAAGRLLRMGVTSGVPGFLAAEIQRAWAASANRRETGNRRETMTA
ncbi:MAG: hypothetical protein HYZ58_14715 [Acidobacteria bacterium]|nr:hypothetical protein [Acidobacteriota bacterium]